MSWSFSHRFTAGFRNQVVWGCRSLTDPMAYFFVSLGLIGWFIPTPDHILSWSWLLLKAFFEEFFFRFILQEMGERLFKRKTILGSLTLANLCVSLAFAGMHLFRQPPFWAAMTIGPSLVFGLAWNRYKSVLPVSLIHFSFNMSLFYPVL